MGDPKDASEGVKTKDQIICLEIMGVHHTLWVPPISPYLPSIQLPIFSPLLRPSNHFKDTAIFEHINIFQKMFFIK